ncbi:MAG: DUF2497 domain-containing protein [Holosporales bacterium]|jgi:cell pole-organizing protein PopZ|nr:DUF2497 domain-containing protein [Holosporales bacterium]
MNCPNINPEEEMSMEDILSSIRKHVSETDENKEKDLYEGGGEGDSDTETVISLDESSVVAENPDHSFEIPESFKKEASLIYEEKSSLSEEVLHVKENRSRGPFEQLTNALNSYGKSKLLPPKEKGNQLTVEQLFFSIAENVVEKWVKDNMRKLVEEMVSREIERIKSE